MNNQSNINPNGIGIGNSKNNQSFPSQYSLHNSDNYMTTFHFQMNDILQKYKILVNEYLKFIIENMNCKSLELFNYIILRGLTTITHVFKFILFTTKNLNMTYFHSQKAFYYYVEFIGQITGEQNTFLQLTSKDAVMFVYKKTIFEIHNDYKKVLTNDEVTVLNILDIYSDILKTIICNFINNIDFIKIKEENKCDDYLINIEKTCDIIITTKTSDNQLKKIKIIIEYLADYKEKYHETIQILIPKIIKNKTLSDEISEEKFKEKMSKITLDENTVTTNIETFINHVLDI